VYLVSSVVWIELLGEGGTTSAYDRSPAPQARHATQGLAHGTWHSDTTQPATDSPFSTRCVPSILLPSHLPCCRPCSGEQSIASDTFTSVALLDPAAAPEHPRLLFPSALVCQSSRRITDHPRIPHCHAACAISSVHGASAPSLCLAISTPGHELFHCKLDGALVLLQCSNIALAVFKPHLVEIAEQLVPIRGTLAGFAVL